MKVGFVSDTKVVTLEETDRRYNERHGRALPDPYADYGRDCFFDSCSLEVTFLMAKYSLAGLTQVATRQVAVATQ